MEIKNWDDLLIVSVGEPRLENDGEVRADGKPARLFYTVEFGSKKNPLLRTRTRNFFQQHVNVGGDIQCVWRGANPAIIISKLVGKTVPGKILELDVEPYELEVQTKNGPEMRTIKTYTCVVMDGEMPNTVFKQNGHILLEDVEATAEKVEVIDEVDEELAS